MKNSARVAVLAGVLMIAPAVKAEYIASVGFAPFGGENLIVSAGDDLEAGAGLYGDVGVLHQPVGSVVAYQATFGLKLNFVEFDDGGDADVVSLPLNFMIFYNGANSFRFGAGITYELAPEFTFDARGVGSTIEFDDSLGFAIEADYFLNEKAFVGARFTAIDYDMPAGRALVTRGGQVVTSVDANNLGVHIGIMF